MTTKSDWMATSHEQLADQANAMVNYLTPGVLDRIGIAGTALTWYTDELLVKYDKFHLTFEDWKNPATRTPAKSAALVDAENDFRKTFRQFYSGFLRRNPLVTDEDLVNMNMPKRPSGGKTPPSPPVDVIEATVDTSKPGMIGINYRSRNEKGTAKPKGVHGAEIAHAVLHEPPADWSQLTNSSFDTRTPVQFSFPGEQRGHTFYFALRWENTRGDKGPWSEIYSAIIP
jgi:hypothetical protein